MAAKPSEAVQRKAPNKKEANEKLEALITELQGEADERVGRRTNIEERWLLDLAQYHGQYDEKIVKSLKEAKRSTLFINLTRPKTNAMEARLSDMLFPTDDRNWGINPTPVPELVIEAEEVARATAEAVTAAQADPENASLEIQAAQAELELARVQARLDEAKKRARSMEEEIDDHLRQCRYSIQARDVIRDGCKIGTGVFKGPVTGGNYKKTWEKRPLDQAQEENQAQAAKQAQDIYQIVYSKDQRPEFWRVDPWNFFPDSDAASMDENERVYERHLLNNKQMRKLARNGFDSDAIRELLYVGPEKGMPAYLTDLKTITHQETQLVQDRYIVWEYHGLLTGEQIEAVAIAIDRDDLIEDVGGEIDPLEEIHVTLFFCQGKLLKIGLHHLDSGDSIYSVFNLEKDETSLFGYGIPYIMRDPQKSLAGAWRVLMDNMGLSSGPQIVINDDVIEPVNGEWVIEGRKLWRRKGTAPPDKKPFETFDIPSHMEELMAVIDLSKTNIDEETAMPMIAQGEQGAQVTKTAHGMSLLMNSVNVVFRRIVKNWDDDVTVPSITRIYDWLMQFSPKDHIKGDYQVDARGSSVLLVREMQSQNLMLFLMNFVGHPLLGKFLKEDGLPALRRLVQTLIIPADEVLKSAAEIKRDLAEAAKQPPPPDPEMEKIAASLNLEQMKGQTAMMLEEMRRETALIQLAGQANLKLEELKAMLNDKQLDRDSKERMMAAEAAIELRQAEHGEQKGSGGYFS